MNATDFIRTCRANLARVESIDQTARLQLVRNCLQPSGGFGMTPGLVSQKVGVGVEKCWITHVWPPKQWNFELECAV